MLSIKLCWNQCKVELTAGILGHSPFGYIHICRSSGILHAGLFFHLVSQIANECQGSTHCEYEKQGLFINFRAFPTVTFPLSRFSFTPQLQNYHLVPYTLVWERRIVFCLSLSGLLFQGIICVETRMLTSLPKLQSHMFKMFEQLIHILIWAQNSQPVVFKLTIETMLGIITPLYVFHKGKSTFSLYSAVLGTQKRQ